MTVIHSWRLCSIYHYLSLSFCIRMFLSLVCFALSSTPVRASTYGLGASALLIGPAAGNGSVVLAVTPATTTWTAAANANWLHLSTVNQSGTGSTNVVFSYNANTGTTRSGTLTIAGQTLT